MGGRKRTRYIITAEQMKAFSHIKELLQLDRIFNNTTIFKEHIHGGPLDEKTVKQIKATFSIWHDSWIKPNLDKL